MDARRPTCSLRLALGAALVACIPSAPAEIEFSNGFNFRTTRYDKPLRFTREDAITVGGTITDTDTGGAPANAIVQAINANPATGSTQPFVVDLRRFGSSGYFTEIPYDPQLATGSWDIVVSSDVGEPAGFTLAPFGIGPGTGPIPDVVSNLEVSHGAVGAPVMSWNVPADLGARNDGNIDRLRVRHLDSNGAVLVDERLPSGTSLTTESYVLPEPTHDGLYQSAVRVEGLAPFIRGETFTDSIVQGIGTGGQPIDIAGTFLLHDNRQPNSVNFNTGEVISVGVNVNASGPNNTDPFNTFAYAQQGDQVLALTRAGDRPTEFSSSFTFDPALTGAWSIHLDNGEHDRDTFTGDTGLASATPTGLGTGSTLEFVRNTTITTGAGAPVLEWTLPDGSTHDRIDIGLFDDVTNARIPLGLTGGLFRSLPSDATSFQFADDFFGVRGLDPNGHYVARVMLRETLGPSISARSLSFVNFSPSLDTGGDPVFIPNLDDQGVFRFDIDVEALVPLVLDPFVAIGYIYDNGGGPNFATVEMPTIAGDDEFLLEFDDGSGVLQQHVLLSGETFDFLSGTGGAGISNFTVRDIDPAVGLDPADTLAFMTTVSFATSGQFQGSMTPITVFVPENRANEPGTLALLIVGLTAVLVWRRRRR